MKISFDFVVNFVGANDVIIFTMLSDINSRTSGGNVNVAFMSSSNFSFEILGNKKRNELNRIVLKLDDSLWNWNLMIDISIYRYVEVIPKTVCRSIAISFDVMHHISES